VAPEVCSSPAKSASLGVSDTAELPTSAANTCFLVISASLRSRDEPSKKTSIPVNYGPAPFKRRYRKCSGDPRSITPKPFGARSLPINAKGFTYDGSLAGAERKRALPFSSWLAKPDVYSKRYAIDSG
jgi:hypothetical protein